MRKVVGGNGSGTIDGLAPIAMAGYELFVKDFVTLGDPKATVEEKKIAGMSVLPIGKPLKATKAYNKQRVIENVNESKKARESSNFCKYLIKEKEVLENIKNSTKKGEGKEQDSKQFAEYVKNLDKGTGKCDDFAKEPFLLDEYYNNNNVPEVDEVEWVLSNMTGCRIVSMSTSATMKEKEAFNREDFIW